MKSGPLYKDESHSTFAGLTRMPCTAMVSVALPDSTIFLAPFVIVAVKRYPEDRNGVLLRVWDHYNFMKSSTSNLT